MLFGRMPGDELLGRTPLVAALPALAGGAPHFNSRLSGQRLQPYGAPMVAPYRGGPVAQLSSVSPVAAAAAAQDWLVGRDRERRIARPAGATDTLGTAEKGGADPRARTDRDYYDLADRIGGVFAGDLAGKLDFDGIEYVQLAGLLLQEIAKWAQSGTNGQKGDKPADPSANIKQPALPETVPVSWAGFGTHRPNGSFRSNPPSLSPTGPKGVSTTPRLLPARHPSFSLLA